MRGAPERLQQGEVCEVGEGEAKEGGISMPTTLYAIANVEHQCYGHGDYGSGLVIPGPNSYGGKWPEIFASEDDARTWLKARRPLAVIGKDVAIAPLVVHGS